MFELSAPWAIKPVMLPRLAETYAASVRDGRFLDMSAGKQPVPSMPGYDLRDGVAVIQLNGILLRREPSWSGLFDVTSTAHVSEALRLALSDSSVRAMVLIGRFKRDVSLQRQYGSISRYVEATDPQVFHGYDREVQDI